MQEPKSRSVNLPPFMLAFSIVPALALALEIALFLYGETIHQALYAIPFIIPILPLVFIGIELENSFPFLQPLPFWVVIAFILGPIAVCLLLVIGRICLRIRNRFGRAVVGGLIVTVAGYMLFIAFSSSLSVNTRYAPGYSEAAFNSIKIGDSEEKVFQLLGEPLYRYQWSDSTDLRYSDSPSGVGFAVRIIDIDKNHKVISISHEVAYPNW